MNSRVIRTLFDYHYGMFDTVWESVMDLTAEQFVAENGYSLASVRNHLVHCMNVDERWLARLRGIAPPDNLVEDDFPDQELARVMWQVIRERVRGNISKFSEEDLDETISVSLPHRFPEPKQNTRRDILLHMVNHGTDHRAQILARLHELGARTMEQDLILYLWKDS